MPENRDEWGLGWYVTEDVPFSWKEWMAISKSSTRVYGQRDKNKILNWQKKGDYVNKTIGTRMNFLIRAFDAKDKDQLAYVQCHVARKPRKYQKEKTLKKKQPRWRQQKSGPSKVSQIQDILKNK